MKTNNLYFNYIKLVGRLNAPDLGSAHENLSH